MHREMARDQKEEEEGDEVVGGDTKGTQFISTTTAIDGAIMLACLSFCGVFQHFQKPGTFDLKCTLKKYVYFGPRWQQKSKIFTAEILSASADANFEKF